MSKSKPKLTASQDPTMVKVDGVELRTGCLLPEVKPNTVAPLTAAPGFKTWTRTEIEEYCKKKPVRRREQFSGKDWVLNQANRGSCNCAALCGALRRTFTINGRNDVPQLSWEFAYAQLVDGNDQGSMLDDGMNFVLMGTGLPPLDPAKHPLNKHIRKRDYSPEEYAAAKGWRAELCYQTDDPLELATGIAMGGAGVVAVHVGSRFTNLDSKGYAGADSGPGNHAVCVGDIEMVDGKIAFDHVGSWSTSMHDDGYAYFDWD